MKDFDTWDRYARFRSLQLGMASQAATINIH